MTANEMAALYPYADDVLLGRATVPAHQHPSSAEEAASSRSETCLRIILYLRRGPRTPDDIGIDLGIGPLVTGAALHELEERGAVARMENEYVSKEWLARKREIERGGR